MFADTVVLLCQWFVYRYLLFKPDRLVLLLPHPSVGFRLLVGVFGVVIVVIYFIACVEDRVF
jgi:hypothetical protein